MNIHDAELLVASEFTKHGLTAKGWTFGWDRATRRFGVTKPQSKVITMSQPLTLLNGKDQVLDTIRHEIAHAIAWDLGDRGHGRIWRQTAIRIGCNGERTHDAIVPPAPILGTCPNGHTTTRNRRPSKMTACGKCCKAHNRGRFDTAYLFTWTDTRVSA